MRPLAWSKQPTPLPKGRVHTFEDAKYLAYIDNDPQISREVYVVIVRGKLPGGNHFHRARDFRESYAEARALVRKLTGL